MYGTAAPGCLPRAASAAVRWIQPPGRCSPGPAQECRRHSWHLATPTGRELSAPPPGLQRCEQLVLAARPTAVTTQLARDLEGDRLCRSRGRLEREGKLCGAPTLTPLQNGCNSLQAVSNAPSQQPTWHVDQRRGSPCATCRRRSAEIESSPLRALAPNMVAKNEGSMPTSVAMRLGLFRSKCSKLTRQRWCETNGSLPQLEPILQAPHRHRRQLSQRQQHAADFRARCNLSEDY